MLYRITLLLALLEVCAATPLQDFHNHGSKAPKYLVTFGDSYSQTGFNLSLSLPTPSNPLGNPPFPGWTTSGGVNWIGYLVSKFNTTSLLSYNFASGGATVDASLVIPFRPTVLSLIDQVTIFTSYLSSSHDATTSHPATPHFPPKSTLYALWLGVNDVGNSEGNSTDAVIWDKIATAYFSQLSRLYDTGARNFALLNVPPTQLSPMVLGRSQDVQTHWGAVVLAFNKKIETAAKIWTRNHRGANVKIVDTQKPFKRVLANPVAYGANATGATCYADDGTTCLWWNNYHPGMAIQESVAAAVVGRWRGSFF